jgi:hypothetical protein
VLERESLGSWSALQERPLGDFPSSICESFAGVLHQLRLKQIEQLPARQADLDLRWPLTILASVTRTQDHRIGWV